MPVNYKGNPIMWDMNSNVVTGNFSVFIVMGFSITIAIIQL